jgi:hypothetical protein
VKLCNALKSFLEVSQKALHSLLQPSRFCRLQRRQIFRLDFPIAPFSFLFQNKIKEVIQAEVEGTGSEIEVSDGEISEIDRAGRLSDLYQKKLPELVQNLLNPLLFHLVEKVSKI